MYTAELFNGSLPPSELRKRTQWVRTAKDKDTRKVCRYPGCITPISAYHRDDNGNQESLCRRHYSEMNDPTRGVSAAKRKQIEKARQAYQPLPLCKKRQHDISVVGRYESGACKACERIDALERRKNQRKAQGKPPEAPRIYKLKNLKALKREWGGTYEMLAAQTGLAKHSITKWMNANVGTYHWNAETLAEFFSRELGRTITIEDLKGVDV